MELDFAYVVGFFGSLVGGVGIWLAIKVDSQLKATKTEVERSLAALYRSMTGGEREKVRLAIVGLLERIDQKKTDEK